MVVVVGGGGEEYHTFRRGGVAVVVGGRRAISCVFMRSCGARDCGAAWWDSTLPHQPASAPVPAARPSPKEAFTACHNISSPLSLSPRAALHRTRSAYIMFALSVTLHVGFYRAKLRAEAAEEFTLTPLVIVRVAKRIFVTVVW